MIAVVIPYYKKAFFRETLQSLADQSNKKFRVYIGDDGSPETPKDLIREFESEIDLVYQRFESNLGGISLVKHWERCLEMIGQEQWLAFMGDDDVWSSNHIETFYNNLNTVIEKKINVIRFSSVKIDEYGQSFSKQYKHPIIEKSRDFIFRQTRSSLSEYVFKRDKLLSVGFKDFALAWYSDIMAVLEVSDFENVYTINQSVVGIRLSSSSISGNRDLIYPKLRAQFSYHYRLLSSYSDKFNKLQQEQLMGILNKSYIYNKLCFLRYFKIVFLYMKMRCLKSIMKLNQEIIQSIFR